MFLIILSKYKDKYLGIAIIFIISQNLASFYLFIVFFIPRCLISLLFISLHVYIQIKKKDFFVDKIRLTFNIYSMKHLLEFAQYAPRKFDPAKIEVIGKFEKGKLVEELFKTTAGTISEIGRKSILLTNKWYEPFGYKFDLDSVKKDLSADGVVISNEHLMKMANNRTVFYHICKSEKISNSADFLVFMLDPLNLQKYYHWTGTGFREVHDILKNASNKGEAGEKAAFGFYKWLMKQNGKTINILPPTLREDIAGIDGKFYLDGELKTIQVKPYETFVIEGRIGKATCNGSLSMNTDILILYKSRGMKAVKDKAYSMPDFSFIISEAPVVIEKNQFILTNWQAKGEKVV